MPRVDTHHQISEGQPDPFQGFDPQNIPGEAYEDDVTLRLEGDPRNPAPLEELAPVKFPPLAHIERDMLTLGMATKLETSTLPADRAARVREGVLKTLARFCDAAVSAMADHSRSMGKISKDKDDKDKDKASEREASGVPRVRGAQLARIAARAVPMSKRIKVPAKLDENGKVLEPAHYTSTASTAFDMVANWLTISPLRIALARLATGGEHDAMLRHYISSGHVPLPQGALTLSRGVFKRLAQLANEMRDKIEDIPPEELEALKRKLREVADAEGFGKEAESLPVLPSHLASMGLVLDLFGTVFNAHCFGDFGMAPAPVISANTRAMRHAYKPESGEHNVVISYHRWPFFVTGEEGEQEALAANKDKDLVVFITWIPTKLANGRWCYVPQAVKDHPSFAQLVAQGAVQEHPGVCGHVYGKENEDGEFKPHSPASAVPIPLTLACTLDEADEMLGLMRDPNARPTSGPADVLMSALKRHGPETCGRELQSILEQIGPVENFKDKKFFEALTRPLVNFQEMLRSAKEVGLDPVAAVEAARKFRDNLMQADKARLAMDKLDKLADVMAKGEHAVTAEELRKALTEFTDACFKEGLADFLGGEFRQKTLKVKEAVSEALGDLEKKEQAGKPESKPEPEFKAAVEPEPCKLDWLLLRKDEGPAALN